MMKTNRRFLVVFVLMLGTCAATLAANVWTTNAPVPAGFGREGACVGKVGNTIYFIAGFGPSGDSTTNSAYTIAKNSWTVGLLAPIPGPARSEVAGVSHRGSVYCLGGRSFTAINLNQRYDPKSNTWTTLAPMLIGVDAEYSAAVVDDRIHVIGGRIDGATVPFSAPKTSAHQVYDIASNAWSLAAPLPGASRSEMCAVVHEDNIYVMGGNIVPFDGAVASVDIYDAEEGTWRAGPPMPAPRANAACAALGDSIYVIGGIHPFGIFHSDVFRFDVERGTWTTVTSAPEPIATAETPGIRHGRRIFVVGGGFFGSGGGAVGTTNQSFRPRSEEEDEGE